MTVYPFELDSDVTISRVDDNITQIGGEVLNAVRDAVFAIEAELGINPSGALDSLNDFLDVSFNENGTIKASALTSVGLVTLPITNNQVGDSAGIKESKLDLDFSTVDLNTLITANATLLNSLNAFAVSTNSNLLTHIAGGTLLADGITKARHVGSHIDLNAVPSDARDTSFVWGGLFDKDNVARTATTVAGALDQISTELVAHQNITEVNSPGAHPASAISVDGSVFTEIPIEVNDVQEALEAIDDLEIVNLGTHRSTMHANGVPRTARSLACAGPDGYSTNVVPVTPIVAHLAHGGAAPVDDSSFGDDIIDFMPTNTGFLFDSQFAKVAVGDIIRVNYGNGLEAAFEVESLRFIPGSEWTIRINGTNLADTDGYTAFARIDRPKFDTETFGVLAAGSANNDISSATDPSVVIAHPKSASALGVGFNPDKLDSTHFNLYLNIYPTGNPIDRIIQLPAIDVTGNAGATPGRYTLNSVVDETNNALRKAGFNYRLIAYSQDGEFGVAMADAINCASFSIINGIIDGAVVNTGAFTNNVVADAADADGLDPLGFGINAANVASPDFVTTFPSAPGALVSTNVIAPLKRRNYTVNGTRRDNFAPTYLATLDANRDGYWPATITTSVLVGVTTVETTYRISMDLRPAGLKPGKTLVVQPTIEFTDANYKDADYGRFFIKSVFFDDCGGPNAATEITVLNSIHATGSPIGSFAPIGEEVNIYFSEDTVGFNSFNASDAVSPGSDFVRFHEIFVDDTGTTFSHERARMLDQAASGTDLDTSKWHIRDVSPKLRGYIDDGDTGPDRYVRLFILNYNTVSGEFDGYLGKRDPLTDDITRLGPITTGRKNVVTRFYDETHIDFIDFEFVELVGAGDPGTSILTTPTDAQFVDVQVYPSLQLDDEFMLLAKCELKKNGSFVQVQGIRDARDFGNVSEKEFTTSAIKFIQAGDRQLHSNGIIRGFTCKGTDATNDKRLFFDGGVALVNGAFSMVNNTSIIIPEIKLETDAVAPPSNVYTWAVCVNEFNQLDSILITATKDQFFATLPSGGTAFYVESTTFAELINVRKDLTPIAIVNVSIASVTINSIKDARRFIRDETQNIPFTWVPEPKRVGATTPEDELVGHFQTFEAVTTWINNYGSTNNTVHVRGTIVIENPIDLNEFTSPVIFEGDGPSSTFHVIGDRGFLLGDDITFRDIRFKYTPDNLSAVSTNFINTGDGLIYGSSNSTTVRRNILIEDCIFEMAEEKAERPPFINFEFIAGGMLRDFMVNRCQFTDTRTSGANRPQMAAIAIVESGSVNGQNASLLFNSKITNNECNHDQGIHITSTPNVAFNFLEPGLKAANVEISGNNCGIIGYMISSTKEDSALNTAEVIPDPRNRTFGLTIERNNCAIITHTSTNGKIWNTQAAAVTTTVPSTGHVRISKNNCSWILVTNVRDNTEVEESSLIISENILQASAAAILEVWNAGGGAFATIPNIAIGVSYDVLLGANNVANTQITNNKIVNSTTVISAVDTTFYYDVGINCINSGVISGNVIDGVSSAFGSFGGVGIRVGGSVGEYLVTNNKISRRARTLAAYISVIGTAAPGGGVVVDNYFDTTSSDGLSLGSIITSGSISDWVIERNKNQIATKLLNFASGNFGVGQTTAITDITTAHIAGDTGATSAVQTIDTVGASITARSLLTGASASFAFLYDTTAASGVIRSYLWQVSLEEVLPSNVQILSAEVTTSSNAVLDSSSDFLLRVASGDNTVVNDSTVDFTGAYVIDTKLKASVVSTLKTGVGNDAYLMILSKIIRAAGDAVVTVEASTATGSNGVLVRYKW